MRKIMSLAGSAVLLAAFAAPVGAGSTPQIRCDYADPNNNGETGDEITISVKALKGHGITAYVGEAKKVTICHYHGHEAANGRADEIIVVG